VNSLKNEIIEHIQSTPINDSCRSKLVGMVNLFLNDAHIWEDNTVDSYIARMEGAKSRASHIVNELKKEDPNDTINYRALVNTILLEYERKLSRTLDSKSLMDVHSRAKFNFPLL
jgi:hypothetical protein